MSYFPDDSILGSRQSGDKPAYHGRITKQGRAHARSMLVEAAWVISGAPGPLRAFFIRIRDKRGKQVAAVATARKLAVVVWHMLTKDEDFTLEPSGAPAVETSETGAESRTSISPRRQAEGVCRRLQRQVGARQRARDNRQCRGRIPPVRCELETAIAKGALERRKRGATIISCATGLQPRPCSSPRGHPSCNSLSQSQSPSIPDANG